VNGNVNHINLPSFRVLVVFIISILLSNYLISASLLYFELTASIVILLLFLLIHPKKYKHANIIIAISLIFLFLFYSHSRVVTKPFYSASKNNNKVIAFAGKVVSYPYCRVSISKKSKVKIRQEYLLEADEVILGTGKFKQVDWKILVKSRNHIENLRLGSHLIIYSKAFPVNTIKKFKLTKSKSLPCWQYSLASNKDYRSFDSRFLEVSRRFDYKEYLHDIGIDYLSYPFKASKIKLLPKPKLNWIESIAVEAHYFIADLFRFIKEPERSFLKGLILGEREGIADYIKNNFRESGVSHILAVSGLHVGFIALAIMFILRLIFFRLPSLTLKRIIITVTACILVVYVIVVGYRPSVLRAVIMFICGGMVIIFDRDRNYLNPLFISAIIILLINPSWLFTISFQLSFLATLGIILYFRVISDWITDKIKLSIIADLEWIGNLNKVVAFMLKWIVNIFVLTISAQIFIIPILVYQFGGYSFISFISHIAIIFFTMSAVGLVFVLSLAFSLDTLFTFFSIIIEYVILVLLEVSKFFADIPFAYIDLDIGLWVLLYYPIFFIMLHYKAIRSLILDSNRLWQKILRLMYWYII
jgi:competence protein ComEC